MPFRRIVLASGLAGVLALGGCFGTSDVDNIESQIQGTVGELGQQSTDWRTALADLEAKLASDGSDLAHSTLAQVQLLASQSINNVNGNFLCDTDFVRGRVSTSLEGIRDQVMGKPAPALVPKVCSVSPDQLVVADVQKNLVTGVRIYGYDLTRDDEALSLVSSSGEATPIPASDVDYPSPYEMTLNVGSNGLQLGSSAQKIAFGDPTSSGGQSIGIVQPPPAPPVRVPIMVSNLTISFADSDGKDHDTGVAVRINRGATSALNISQGADLTFPDNGDAGPFLLTPATVKLQDLSGVPFEICETPNGNDDWQFNWTLTGHRSDGGTYADGGHSALSSDNSCSNNPTNLATLSPPFDMVARVVHPFPIGPVHVQPFHREAHSRVKTKS